MCKPGEPCLPPSSNKELHQHMVVTNMLWTIYHDSTDEEEFINLMVRAKHDPTILTGESLEKIKKFAQMAKSVILLLRDPAF